MALIKNNHTQIANEFIDKYMHQLNGAAVKVFLVIARQTIGWHKDIDPVAISQLEIKTGLTKKTIISAVGDLVDADIITATKNTGKTTKYSINYTSVIITPAEEEPVEKVHTPCVESTQVKAETGVKSTHTKEIILKETISKEILITSDEPTTLTQKLYDYMDKPTRWEKKPPNLIEWAKDIEKLHRIDGISYDLIDQVIEWIFKHDRWKWREIIQSASGLRKHFDAIEKRMPKSMKQTSGTMQNNAAYYEKMMEEMVNNETC